MSDKNGNTEPRRYFRKIIHIPAEDSPNVRWAKAEIASGIRPTGRILVPGLLTYRELRQRRKVWDRVMQCIGLDAQFWMGAEVLLFPPEWLNIAERLYDEIRSYFLRRDRVAESIGIDPGEGGANTVITGIDRNGLIEMESQKTPDTQDIIGWTKSFASRHKIGPQYENCERICFDSGGGGIQLVQQLRREGWWVNAVGFGESVQPKPGRGIKPIVIKSEEKEERYSYKNRRSQMYGMTSILFDPSMQHTKDPPPVFTIPPASRYGEPYTRLRHQLSLMPKRYDGEGRLYLPPKNKRDTNSKEETLTQIIGYSPDEADSLVVAVYNMMKINKYVEVGPF